MSDILEQTYRFSGPMPGRKVGRNKGIMRQYKHKKREEAESRQKSHNKKASELQEVIEAVLEEDTDLIRYLADR